MNKTDKMYLEIESGSHDIVVLTETRLDHSILDSEIFPSNFIVFRNDRQHLKWNDAKPFWNYVNSIRKRTNNLVLPLKVGNEEIYDLRIAETHIVFVGVYGRSV